MIAELRAKIFRYSVDVLAEETFLMEASGGSSPPCSEISCDTIRRRSQVLRAIVVSDGASEAGDCPEKSAGFLK